MIDIWAASWQNKQCGCAPSEDSDQPGHPPSLIRVFAVRMKNAWVLSYQLSAQLHEERLGHWLPIERTPKTDQTGRMPRLIWVFAGRTVIFLVLSRGGLIIILTGSDWTSTWSWRQFTPLFVTLSQTRSFEDESNKHRVVMTDVKNDSRITTQIKSIILQHFFPKKASFVTSSFGTWTTVSCPILADAVPDWGSSLLLLLLIVVWVLLYCVLLYFFVFGFLIVGKQNI